MNNEHNPIALRINKLQELWIQERKKKPNSRLIRWMIEEHDLPLVNGFYKLESTPYGKIEEYLIVLLSDFDSKTNFSYHLAHDWIQSFEQAQQEYPDLYWPQFAQIKEEFEQIKQGNPKQANSFFVYLLEEYKQALSPNRMLLVGINPRKVYDHSELNTWTDSLLQLLPKTIGIVFTDYKQSGYYNEVFQLKQWANESLTISLKDQDIKAAYNQLMTQGNPNDPQVQFRTCMIGMAEAANQQDKKGVYHWGNKALQVTKSTGKIEFWASAFLVFAGNLFYFQDSEKIFELLNQGIEIGHSQPENQALQGVLLQLYAFKASYFLVEGEAEQAIEHFLIQADLAEQANQTLVAVTAYKNALIVAQQNDWQDQLQRISDLAFPVGYSLEDDYLKATEFGFIALHYLQQTNQLSETQHQEIEQRLNRLFGEDWKQQNTIQIPSKQTQNIF